MFELYVRWEQTTETTLITRVSRIAVLCHTSGKQIVSGVLAVYWIRTICISELLMNLLLRLRHHLAQNKRHSTAL